MIEYDPMSDEYIDVAITRLLGLIRKSCLPISHKNFVNLMSGLKSIDEMT